MSHLFHNDSTDGLRWALAQLRVSGTALTQAFAWCNDPPVGRRLIPGFGCIRPRRVPVARPRPAGNSSMSPLRPLLTTWSPRGGTGCSRNPRLVSQSSEGTPCSICIGRCRSPAAPTTKELDRLARLGWQDSKIEFRSW